jgi:hypothetical protein
MQRERTIAASNIQDTFPPRIPDELFHCLDSNLNVIRSLLEVPLRSLKGLFNSNFVNVAYHFFPITNLYPIQCNGMDTAKDFLINAG